MTDGEFLFPSVLQSNCIFCVARNIVSFKVKANFSGTVRLFVGVSADIQTIPSSWEEVPLSSGVTTNYTMIASNKAFFYKVLKDNEAVLSSVMNIYGLRTVPALMFSDFVVS